MKSQKHVWTCYISQFNESHQLLQVSAPKSHPELLRELSTGPRAEDTEARKMIVKLKGVVSASWLTEARRVYLTYNKARRMSDA